MCNHKNPEFDWEDFNQRKRLEESSQEAQEKKKLIIAKVNKIAEENKFAEQIKKALGSLHEDA